MAYRWKTQINQLAKAGANFEIIPEATHNTLIATINDLVNVPVTTGQVTYKGANGVPQKDVQILTVTDGAPAFVAALDARLARGESIAHFTRHLLGLYQGLPGARRALAQPREGELSFSVKGGGVLRLWYAPGHVNRRSLTPSVVPASSLPQRRESGPRREVSDRVRLVADGRDVEGWALNISNGGLRCIGRDAHEYDGGLYQKRVPASPLASMERT